MSISTFGWGGGAITSSGWGLWGPGGPEPVSDYRPVIAATVLLMPSLQTEKSARPGGRSEVLMPSLQAMEWVLSQVLDTAHIAPSVSTDQVNGSIIADSLVLQPGMGETGVDARPDISSGELQTDVSGESEDGPIIGDSAVIKPSTE